MATQVASSPLCTAATPAVTDTLAPFETVRRVPVGQLLFREGEQPDGVYFLHDGEVDLVFASRVGTQARAFRVAEDGQILGLSSVVSRRPHDCSATARTTVEYGFIPRERFLKILEEEPSLWFAVLQMISADINSCWDCLRSIGKC